MGALYKFPDGKEVPLRLADPDTPDQWSTALVIGQHDTGDGKPNADGNAYTKLISFAADTELNRARIQCAPANVTGWSHHLRNP